MKTRLKWKQKWCDDKSGYWYSAKVPIINWEYIVDAYQEPEEYIGSIFYSPNDNDSTPIISKTFRKKEGAMNACEKHFKKSIEKFEKWIMKNSYEKK